MRTTLLQNSTFNSLVFPALLVALALFIRFPIVHSASPFYTSDTAILDLMAMQMSQGTFSLYYWGERYYGALDPLLLVPLFKLWGSSPLVSQLLPYVLSATFLLMYHCFLLRTADALTAHAATLLLALGSPYFLDATFTTYNYIFTLNFGMLFLLLLPKAVRPQATRVCLLFLGILMGFSWYYLRLILLFWVAGIGWMLLPLMNSKGLHSLSRWMAHPSFRQVWSKGVLLHGWDGFPWMRRLLVLANLGNAANLLVAIVLWIHGDWIAVIHGHTVKLFYEPIMASSLQLACLVLAMARWPDLVALIKKIHGRLPFLRWGLAGWIIGYFPAIAGSWMGHSPASGGSLPTLPQSVHTWRILFTDIFPFMLDPGSGQPLAAAGGLLWVCGAASLGMAAYVYVVRRMKDDETPPLHAFVVLAIANLLVCAVLAKLGDRRNARYLLPFYVTLPLGIVWFLKRTVRNQMAAVAWIGLLLIGNFLGVRKLLSNAQAPAQYADVAESLSHQPYQGGYADYWMAYAITALAKENVIVVPTGSNDRYAPYLDYVRSLKYVTLLGDAPQPIDSVLVMKGVSYRVLAVHRISGIPMMVMQRLT
jgi:hypothetical protein